MWLDRNENKAFFKKLKKKIKSDNYAIFMK